MIQILLSGWKNPFPFHILALFLRQQPSREGKRPSRALEHARCGVTRYERRLIHRFGGKKDEEGVEGVVWGVSEFGTKAR